MSEFYPPPDSRPPNLWDRLKHPVGKNCIRLLLIISVFVGIGTRFLIRKIRPHETIRYKEAMITGLGIAHGIEHFYYEYNKLPVDSSHTPPANGQDTDTDSSSNHPIITILMGKEAERTARQNPHKTDFLDGIKPAKKASPKQAPLSWINGIYLNETTGPYGVVDAWGNHYKIRLDTNNDKQLANPNPDQVKEGRPTLAKRVLVWSAGKDGKWDTWEDNPMTWD